MTKNVNCFLKPHFDLDSGSEPGFGFVSLLLRFFLHFLPSKNFICTVFFKFIPLTIIIVQPKEIKNKIRTNETPVM